jgi:two-component system response regulator YesN
MPFVSGIELAKQVRNKLETTRIIFLTGYDDFEYLHEALLLKSDDYLLKPVKLPDLLTKAKKALDTWHMENSKNEQLATSLPLLQEAFLSDLLYSESHYTDEEINEQLEKLDLSLPDSSFVVYTISVPEQDWLETLYKTIVPVTQTNTIKVIPFHGTELFILAAVTHDAYDQLVQIKNSVKELEKEKDTAFQMIQSSVYDKRADIKKALLEVRVERMNKLADGSDTEETHSPAQLTQNHKEELEQMESFIRLFKTDTFTLSENKKIGVNLSTFISKRIHQFAATDKEDTNQIEFLERIVAAKNKDELYAHIKGLLDKWQERISAEEKTLAEDSVVTRAKDVVDDHYKDPELNLNTLAQDIHVTVPYLSQQFKAEVGMNFTEYLLKKRMEKAKQLLKEASLKTYEIAGEVGYQNAYYFSSSFKKYTGLTPTAYKKQQSESQ